MTSKEKLQDTLDKFTSQIKPEQFDFCHTIKEYDGDCGSVCCIIGWFPKTQPELGFVWKREAFGLTVVDRETNKPAQDTLKLIQYYELPAHIIHYLFFGLRLGISLYSPTAKKSAPSLHTTSSYEEVVEAWKWVIDNLDTLLTELKTDIN